MATARADSSAQCAIEDPAVEYSCDARDDPCEGALALKVTERECGEAGLIIFATRPGPGLRKTDGGGQGDKMAEGIACTSGNQ